VRKVRGQVCPDYHQFLLVDEGAPALPPVSESSEAWTRRFELGRGVLGIDVFDDRVVPFEVQVHESEPELDLEPWDHAIECSLELATGRLGVRSIHTLPRVVLEVAPGAYRVRALYGRLDQWEGEGPDKKTREHYLFLLWPSGPAEPRVLKQWHGERNA
jgi:hypothetical protein